MIQEIILFTIKSNQTCIKKALIELLQVSIHMLDKPIVPKDQWKRWSICFYSIFPILISLKNISVCRLIVMFGDKNELCVTRGFNDIVCTCKHVGSESYWPLQGDYEVILVAVLQWLFRQDVRVHICRLYVYLFVRLFVLQISSHSRIVYSHGNITIPGEGLQILTYTRHLWP